MRCIADFGKLLDITSHSTSKTWTGVAPMHRLGGSVEVYCISPSFIFHGRLPSPQVLRLLCIFTKQNS